MFDRHKNNIKQFSDESWNNINLFSVVKPGKPKRPPFVCNQKLKSSFKKRLSESDQTQTQAQSQTSVTTPIKTLTQSPTLDQTPAQSPTSTKTSAQSPTSVRTPIKTSTQSQKPRTRLYVNKEGIQVTLKLLIFLYS